MLKIARLIAVLVIGFVATVAPVRTAGAAAVTTASLQNIVCNGATNNFVTGFYHNVTVPQGQFCELLQAHLTGSLYANGALQVGVDNSTIAGSISASGVTDNGWICGSSIAGNVIIGNAQFNSDTTTSPGQWVIGDPGSFGSPPTLYCGNTSFDPVPGNWIGGDLRFSHNASGGTISNNDVEDDLTCVANNPPPSGTNNAVRDLNTGQCATLGGNTEAGGDVSSPGDNESWSGAFTNIVCNDANPVVAGFYKNVTVPHGQFCDLLQAHLTGSLYANGALQVGVDNSTISGSINASGVTDNGWVCGSSVAGNVIVANAQFNSDTTTSPGQWVIGDSGSFGSQGLYCGNTQFDPVPGNWIGGDLRFNHNASGGTISNNDVEDDLTCVGNSPPPSGTNNAVDDLNTGQCAALGGNTEPGGDVTSPGDND